ncbi:MAG: pilus assembly PilX N-terminal domain-containing protein [Candidatus Rokubacteria bacterium]|nr:pilus assembly PilX N-terminal domain-containing protein [Candidatus Rokubacteria bacterium]
MKTGKPVNDEQGVAFPMAMIVMAILSALMAAFAVLATSEPQIASNHMASTQARALAETGVERALWALSAGMRATPPSGALTTDATTGNLIPSSVTPFYDGSTFVSVRSVGGFKVTVADGAASNEKVVTAVGYVPNDTNPIAIKKVTAVVMSMKWINPMCGVCAGGENPPGSTTEIKVGGTATVNGSTSVQGTTPAGSYCSGVTPTSAVGSNGPVTTIGGPNLYAPAGGSTTQPGATFPSSMVLSDADMAILKSIAKARGTYYQGNQTWTSPPPNGLIFVDTPSGNPLCAASGSPPGCTAASPSSDLITVDIHGNWSGGWSGWLVVAGTIQISGQVTLNGLVYAQNDVNLNGIGGGSITGAVISTNRVDTTSSTVADSGDTGNAPLIYNCPAVRDGGGSLDKWWTKPGTYREFSGS